MKRFLVADLFYQDGEVEEWVDATKENPACGKHRVKIKDGTERFSYYFKDLGWIGRVDDEQLVIVQWGRTNRNGPNRRDIEPVV
jgi:hypothetical protein